FLTFISTSHHYLPFVFFYCAGVLCVLPSFPTRRSSDLCPFGSGLPHWRPQRHRWNNLRRFPRPNRAPVPREDNNYRVRCSHILRSEEHTSELQSPDHLVCRLLLEKKKQNN